MADEYVYDNWQMDPIDLTDSKVDGDELDYKHVEPSTQEVADLLGSLPSSVPSLAVPVEVKEREEKNPRMESDDNYSQVTQWCFCWNNPNHPRDQEILFDALIDCCKSFGFQYEKGKNGTPHYQGDVQFLKKQCKPSKLMATYGIPHFHWERTEHPGKSRNYCTNPRKEGFIAGPWVHGQNKGEKRKGYVEALEAENVEDALKILAVTNPRDLVLYRDRIVSNLTNMRKKTKVSHFKPRERASFTHETAEMKQWVQENIGVAKDRYKILVIAGGTQLGKTQWARSLGPHVYWTGQTNTDALLNSDAEYLVIDDIEWEFIPGYMKKTLLLGKGDVVITDKYRAKTDIYWDKPCIICTNEVGNFVWYKDPVFWALNTVVVELDAPLF